MNGLADLIAWVIAQGLVADDIDALLEELALRLTEEGFPLLRASIGMPSIDPKRRGLSVTWCRDTGISREAQKHGDEGEALFRRSPIFYLLQNQLEYMRWSLPADADTPPFPVLTDLSDLGATDFVIKITPFPGNTALAGASFSVATDQPGGFSESQLAGFEGVMPALSLACLRIALTRVAKDVLAVYTGDRTSELILNGQIQRGEGASIYAAILLADLKSFTSLNEKHEPHLIVNWLNEHFDEIGQPVVEEGGEILKFMGDSLLAIFPVQGADTAKACRVAMSAAQRAIATNDALNLSRRERGEPEILVDIVLHLGEIFYGNVGTDRRLDFTVIGRAVNEASRIEKLADTLESNLLASAPFAAQTDGAFRLAGYFKLRGVEEQAEIYTWTGAFDRPIHSDS
ncbi:adenylate/guanylate cyclase domain-containing protein [Rhizobium sp. P38BS-XIX]|uniref:adenylate/guanylate cyclase domain-containing protein n=1 Tax=Rhizobium sp. P38BS-XIX TaxID=2726740 RepID=UPI0014565ADE|nr:adenylate/guanylate cyclase domain-containing protein [Rhizobium sp. P38BS-XIX]NLR98075.1 adenylate/guanylate cyclase domain-containing protein [Rhizobium sp. P38BS-XIX]